MTENQCVIDLDTKNNIASTSTSLAQQWVIQMNDELNNLTVTSSTVSEPWKKQSIYKLPSSLTKLAAGEAYKPQTVSIGPYHHGQEHLKGMEETKHRAALHFLKRSTRPLQCFVEALYPVVKDLKDAYNQLDKKWQDDTEAFLELMIVDGCFILELLRTATSSSSDEWDSEANIMGYGGDDPVFRNDRKLYNVVPYLKRDMLMLGNQIPMLVLTTLNIVAENDMLAVDDYSLSKQGQVTKLILKFFSPLHHDKSEIEELGKCLHILDLYRSSLLLLRVPYLKGKIKRAKSHYQQTYDIIMPSATELYDIGIRFKRSKTRSLRDISFRGNVLQLPLIVVNETSESEYLNLIAFELVHNRGGINEVTSYIFFVSSMIDDARDVILLNRCGVIKNALRSDKVVASLFKFLSRGITLDPDSSLYTVYEQVRQYCNNRWRLWRAEFIRTYFPSRRVELSVYLFVLTILQTVFAVLSYRSNK